MILTDLGGHAKQTLPNRVILEEINEEPSYREGNSNNRISMGSPKNLLIEESKGETPH